MPLRGINGCHCDVICAQGLHERRDELENKAMRTGRWALSDRQVEDIIVEVKSIDEQLDAHRVWLGWIDTKIYRTCGPLRTKLEFEQSFASLPVRMISALRTMAVFLRMRPVCWRLCDEVTPTLSRSKGGKFKKRLGETSYLKNAGLAHVSSQAAWVGHFHRKKCKRG